MNDNIYVINSRNPAKPWTRIIVAPAGTNSLCEAAEENASSIVPGSREANALHRGHINASATS